MTTSLQHPNDHTPPPADITDPRHLRRNTAWNTTPPPEQTPPIAAAILDRHPTLHIRFSEEDMTETANGKKWRRWHAGKWSHVPPARGQKPLPEDTLRYNAYLTLKLFYPTSHIWEQK